ncbi:NAD-dependent epimerase/dehydratase family protein [Saprospira sp. CCB-QB6]|uniref:NAD-dependent epimerase/dehydratase family protein n=1 Tax=Saprospira sp. CCB-QB6 TaxID=3023936 RepID=UPI002349A3B8|nr:NAD-dependent epimerase/dehydratase family protein [Saprospira sp. CCB-QB6]WCL81436.1 NAD-dependent epimerase/dehydratase family protein [Saprospira sp. CCB-QB6]
MQIDKTKPVMVTGATGYVAGWLVKKLLEEGLTVHAAVRQPDNKKKTAHLDKLAANSPGEIKYFKADLLTKGAYFEAMQGCSVVFHTASPFISNVKDPQKDLIEPAVKGTENILIAVNQTPSVQRVVLTSSCAAIYTDASECKGYPNGELTEKIWNTTASLKYQPYSYSKTLAEKKAWEMQKAQNRWELVTINPALVMGPPLNPKATTSESFTIMKQLGDGTFKMGAPKLGMGIVDVRDVAEAHFRAAFYPNAKGRYITVGHNSDIYTASQTLLPKYENYPLPKKVAPKWLIWLVGPMVNSAMTRKFVQNNVGHVFKANTNKIRKELNMEFLPLQKTMQDSLQALIDAKIL